MSNRPVCVNCKYEDASKTAPDNMGGTAVWCTAKQQFIDSYARQGVRPKPNGSGTEEHFWCGTFQDYRE